MNRISRWIIAFFFGIAFIFFTWLAIVDPHAMSFVVAVFCALVTILCVFPASAPVTARLIGGGMVAASTWYLICELTRKEPDPNHVQSVNGAIKAMVLFGLPGLWVAVTGGAPRWAKWSKAFHKD